MCFISQVHPGIKAVIMGFEMAGKDPSCAEAGRSAGRAGRRWRERVPAHVPKGTSCFTGRYARVSSAFPHLGEEDCLRGSRGSGTIFFSFCNLRCVFCQNWDISQDGEGVEIGAESWPSTTRGDPSTPGSFPSCVARRAPMSSAPSSNTRAPKGCGASIIAASPRAERGASQPTGQRFAPDIFTGGLTKKVCESFDP
jgi:hypothetical protein